MDITATADSASVQAFATEQYGIARTEELSLKRKELMNNVAAIVPWACSLITFVILVICLHSLVSCANHPTRPARRCSSPAQCRGWRGIRRGSQPNLHGWTAARRHQTAAEILRRDHTQTTARDQMLDLATRGLPGTNQRKGNSKQLKEKT